MKSIVTENAGDARPEAVRPRQAGGPLDAQSGGRRPLSSTSAGRRATAVCTHGEAAKPSIVTVDKSLVDEFKKGLDDYRQQDFFDFRAFNATRAEVSWSGKTLVMEKTEASGDKPEIWKRVTPSERRTRSRQGRQAAERTVGHARHLVQRLSSGNGSRRAGDHRLREVRSGPERRARHLRQDRRSRSTRPVPTTLASPVVEADEVRQGCRGARRAREMRRGRGRASLLACVFCAVLIGGCRHAPPVATPSGPRARDAASRRTATTQTRSRRRAPGTVARLGHVGRARRVAPDRTTSSSR